MNVLLLTTEGFWAVLMMRVTCRRVPDPTDASEAGLYVRRDHPSLVYEYGTSDDPPQ